MRHPDVVRRGSSKSCSSPYGCTSSPAGDCLDSGHHVHPLLHLCHHSRPCQHLRRSFRRRSLQHRNFRSRRLRHQIPLCSQLSHHDVILRTKPKPHSRRCSRRFVHRVTVRRRACRRWLRTRPALAESSSRRRCSTRQTMFDTFLSFSLFCMHSFLQSRFLFSLLPYDT